MVSFNLAVVLFGAKTVGKYHDVAPLMRLNLVTIFHLAMLGCGKSVYETNCACVCRLALMLVIPQTWPNFPIRCIFYRFVSHCYLCGTGSCNRHFNSSRYWSFRNEEKKISFTWPRQSI